MTTYILLLGILLFGAAGKIAYDWVTIDTLRRKVRRRDIIIESLNRVNRDKWIKRQASVGVVYEADALDSYKQERI